MIYKLLGQVPIAGLKCRTNQSWYNQEQVMKIMAMGVGMVMKIGIMEQATVMEVAMVMLVEVMDRPQHQNKDSLVALWLLHTLRV
jgi:hypothetical protein